MLIVEGHITFDHNDRIYMHHFPGNPVVPGSIIVDSIAKIILANGKLINSIGRTRFIRFAHPSKYSYRVTISDSNALWEMFSADEIYAKGLFVLCS